MLTWFSPTYPLDLIYNILNLSTVIFIIIFFGIKYKINKSLFILLIVTTLTPLLINGPLMPWWALSDQNLYLSETMKLRNFEFDDLDIRTSINFPTYIFALSPIPFIENFNSIGLANRLIFSILIIFLARKKMNRYFVYYLLLSPTLLLYSSTALKETVVISTALLALYCLIEKRYILFWFPFLILLYSKPQNGMILFMMYIIYIYIFSIKFKFKISLNVCLCGASLIWLFFFSSDFIEQINSFSQSFLLESNVQGANNPPHQDYENFSNIISRLPQRLIILYLSPFPELTSPVKIIIFFENLLIISVITILFYKLYRKNLNKFLYWFISFITFSSMYALTVINHGTLSRYKISFMIPFLFILFYLNKKKRTNNKNG